MQFIDKKVVKKSMAKGLYIKKDTSYDFMM